MSKHPGGRPIEWTEERKQEILYKLNSYIEETDIPIVEEFVYKNGLYVQLLHDIPEFSEARERLICKKKANLEIGGLTNKINVSMAQFSLKQLGWRDKTDVNLGGQPDNPLQVTINILPIGEKKNGEV